MKKTFLVLIVSLVFGISIQAQTAVGKQTIVGNWKVSWIVIEGDMAYPAIDPITINIDENGKISGNGGCNDYGGRYSFKNPKKAFKKTRKIRFTDVSSTTRMDCQRLVSNSENAFFRSLREADTAVFEKEGLVIRNRPTFVRTSRGNINIQNTMILVREVKPE